MTKPDTFNLEIELGNEAMSSFEDVATVLKVVAAKLENGFNAGCIYDLNGNIVGNFKFKPYL